MSDFEIGRGQGQIMGEHAAAVVGLFWAIRLWLERAAAFEDGVDTEQSSWACRYHDCGYKRLEP